MMEALELPSASDVPHASLRDDPAAVARAQRESSGVSVKEQLGWRHPYEALRRWRDVLEDRQVMVFQGDFPRGEAQGFSVSQSHPYAVVATVKDPPTARCFTLLHEFAHLLLRDSGICVTEEALPVPEDDLARTEDWCQRFAEAFLVDADVLLDRAETGAVRRREAGYEEALRRLASAFKVSRYVVLFRLRHLELLSEARFWTEYERVREELEAAAARRRAKKKEGKGGRMAARQAVQERGRLFTRLVLEGLDREMLSYTEAIDYLGVRLKHLEKVRQLAYG
jgi:Zn-dependent peptidase ImmA (M78 family)